MKYKIDLNTIFQDAIEYEVSSFRLDKRKVDEIGENALDLFYNLKIWFDTKAERRGKNETKKPSDV